MGEPKLNLPYLTKDKLGKPKIVHIFVCGRVTVREPEFHFWAEDSEKANATVSKDNRKMTNNNYGGYADFRRCVTRVIKRKVCLSVVEGDLCNEN